MPVYLRKALYTAEAVVESGGEGHGWSRDRRLDVALSVPEETGGCGGPGTNPEQPFALGYAASVNADLDRAVSTVLDRDRPATGRVRVTDHLPGRYRHTGHGGSGRPSPADPSACQRARTLGCPLAVTDAPGRRSSARGRRARQA